MPIQKTNMEIFQSSSTHFIKKKKREDYVLSLWVREDLSVMYPILSKDEEVLMATVCPSDFLFSRLWSHEKSNLGFPAWYHIPQNLLYFLSVSTVSGSNPEGEELQTEPVEDEHHREESSDCDEMDCSMVPEQSPDCQKEERLNTSMLAQASPIFHSSCEGKLGIALE